MLNIFTILSLLIILFGFIFTLSLFWYGIKYQIDVSDVLMFAAFLFLFLAVILMI